MPTTDPDEPFEIFTPAGKPLGIAARGRVHREGLWHRSAHVFLYNTRGQLLLQQRSASKDLYAGAWDYSVGEHLQPGEHYLQAALRGLAEELSVNLTTLTPLGEPTASEFVAASGDAIDREFQQAYRGTLESSNPAQIRIDATEVAQIEWLTPTQVTQRISRDPDHFTPWLVRDVARFNLGA